MKDPAFLFYSSDFLSGTMLMTNEDVGKYIRLLCLQHQKGHLKEKDLLSICKEHNEEIFSKFKQDEEGNYYNERLEYEANKRKSYSESRRNNRNKVDNTNTCIYLIKDMLTGLTKIGSSNKPERRLVELKNQYQNENLMLIAYVENVEQKLEKELHNMYKEKNQVNEWFKLSEDDISKIIKNNHMKSHMNNHMYEHMENENRNENINIIKIKNKDNRIIGEEENIEILELWETQFNEFYSKYPKKVKKQEVKKWFNKNRPSNELFSSMMNSLEQFRASKDWQKDGGQFIPYPSTWLNQKRWEDETEKPQKDEWLEGWLKQDD